MDPTTTASTSTSASASTAATSQSEKKLEEVDMTAAIRHFSEGTRNMLVQDYSAAVACFQDACKLFDQKYGIGSPECGDVYLQYGTALLELARLETGVIDGVVHARVAELSEPEEDGDEEDGEEEEEEEEENNSDEKNGDSQEAEQENEAKEENKAVTDEEIELSDEEKKVASEALKNEADKSAENTQNDSLCQPSTSKGDTKTEEDDDDDNEASNIEVAWEVLSLAKEVFSRQNDDNRMKLKLAETFQKLGEICIEWENNQNAADLLTQSLSLRKEILSEDDRLIAETYYHLGLAYSFNNDCDKANDCYRSAIQVVETRVENQRKKISQTPADQTDIIETAQREIHQLEELLPEMRAKIEDSQDQMDNAKKALAEEDEEQLNEGAAAAKSQEIRAKPVNDITHLIKRKRQESDSEQSAKVLCSNGHNTSTSDKTEKADEAK